VEQKTKISNGQISNWVFQYQQEGHKRLESKKRGNPFAALHTSKSLSEMEQLRLEDYKLNP
jgi:transposase